MAAYIYTGTHGDDTNASRLAMALLVLALGEKLWHEVAENLVRILASLPDVISGGLEDLGVRIRVRHDSMLQRF